MTSESLSFIRIAPDGSREVVARPVAIEAPVSIEYNGIGYAVMMATPADLVDFAIGFTLSERLAETAADIVDVDHHAGPAGHVLRVTLVAGRTETLLGRVRHRVSDSSCGLCGIENLEQALRPLPRVTATSRATDAALFAALAGLGAHQPLNQMTGAAHAAAQCAADGTIVVVREDVGRHNAFDKLIGAIARAEQETGRDWAGGFALLSSRCSYELVEKAVLAGCPLLVTLSAPTTLAVARAQDAGLQLMVLARDDAVLMSD